MKGFFCCVKGESSNSAAQNQVFDDEPSGRNEFLNRIWRDELQIPQSPGVEDPNAILFPINPPLPANCGPSYQWREILDGTLNFRQTCLLGRGNFGDVYRCEFRRTNQVGAVKIQNRDNPAGHQEFLAEVTTLHEANHPNVIKLLGKCYGRRNRAIVYEFMPNGSLERHIFDYARQRQRVRPQGIDQPTRRLDWETRMKIAVGVAEGLLYLHQELKVINRDVKAGNILLDADFVPKLTDFGLATKVKVNKKGVEKERKIDLMKGTPGYIAPESEYSKLVSTKSDVYSYGAFLLVLFTGRKPFIPNQVPAEAEKHKITNWFLRVWGRFGNASESVMTADTALGNRFSVEGLRRIFETAFMCIKEEPRARPAMADVVQMVLGAANFPVQVVPLLEMSHTI
ncbi:probable serine/threonine-protein kinase PBL7 [Capsella rubella]|nr:probable serine/threonine-protein kinase PBL7 [Capsella rubella]